ncbi:MAG: T9SS type A sorting domain-containing protein [Bacteroidales bacterium]|nr:T9SS type A sorting domain-containing protein [Bacteroidales bacterium]
MVWKGKYHITIKKIGYDIYEIEEANINNDKVFNIVLSEKKYPPTCLYVDPVSLKASWCYPLITSLEEDFEGPEFPPPGWQSLSTCDTTGWIRTNDGSNSSWTIPPWDSYYAAYLDNFTGSDCNGCCEYLITPPVDLRESEDFVLSFDSFYDGAYGQLAFVEYSFDEGVTWEVLYQVMPATDWSFLEIDLGAFGGPDSPEKMWFAFHADDAGSYASGWAIDNVSINVPSSPALFQDFSVFLDDAYVGKTATLNWDFAPLAYGQIYTASVAANYSSGLSTKDYYTFECKYLFPPQNLSGSAPDDAVILAWDPPGSIVVPYNLYGYNIYRDDVFINYIPHMGFWEPQSYIDQELQPGIYSYSITGVYDLEPYGLPGETGESMKEGPEMVTVDYCMELEFMETWDLGSFGVNNWISDGPNWYVNGQTGNPAPVAEFSGSPVQTDYEISLESYPICAIGLTEGRIWLDFDLAMYSIQSTGKEFLQVQVWGWDTHEWTTVSEYCNDIENYSWSLQRIDISSLASDKIIKIRFKAFGAFSPDMRGWFIDNIHVYRTCPAPENLSIDPYFYEGIRLTWEFPENGNSGLENGTRELVGYLVYRSVDGGNYELLTENYTSMPYIDPDTNLVLGSMHCYKVKAVYESQSDQCISDFSNEVCEIWTGIAGKTDFEAELINLYPNPATDHFVVKSSEKMIQIWVYNAMGNLVHHLMLSSDQLEMNTSTYPAGVYVIRIQTNSGITSRLLTIQR